MEELGLRPIATELAPIYKIPLPITHAAFYGSNRFDCSPFRATGCTVCVTGGPYPSKSPSAALLRIKGERRVRRNQGKNHFMAWNAD